MRRLSNPGRKARLALRLSSGGASFRGKAIDCGFHHLPRKSLLTFPPWEAPSEREATEGRASWPDTGSRNRVAAATRPSRAVLSVGSRARVNADLRTKRVTGSGAGGLADRIAQAITVAGYPAEPLPAAA